ncbi:MAG: N-acetyl-alpha-D-glucosaminyl L-malate deacetylase 1 [Anaerolineales bacterium]|nr:N-acetyl-alpha-D-glucosaminyl L-malate deacetylase 1 [Anaerolineales bacterium]
MITDDVQHVMVISAHPDDAEFGAGGAVAKWVHEGKAVVYVVATRGEKGSGDPDMSSERLAEIREQEQRAAARRLGVSEVVFLGYIDGELQPDLDLRRDITREIRRWRPDLVVCQNPTTFYVDGYINHPDHRAVGEATLAAIFPIARDHLNFPEQKAEGLQPHKVKYVYMNISPDADIFVDITDTIEVKIRALWEHDSQFDDPEQLAERLRERAAETAERAREQGNNVGEYAEAFKLIDLSARG